MLIVCNITNVSGPSRSWTSAGAYVCVRVRVRTCAGKRPPAGPATDSRPPDFLRVACVRVRVSAWGLYRVRAPARVGGRGACGSDVPRGVLHPLAKGTIEAYVHQSGHLFNHNCTP